MQAGEVTAKQCKCCGIQLAVREAQDGEKIALWECRNCGTRLTGVADEHARQGIAWNAMLIPAANLPLHTSLNLSAEMLSTYGGLASTGYEQQSPSSQTLVS